MNNSTGSVVVTGGLGYIGSHLVETLQKKAFQILILDKAESFKYGPLPSHVKHFKINLAADSSIEDMAKIFSDLPSNTIVIHLAAEKSVEESIKNPEYYERENVEGTRNLLAAMSQSHLDRMIFSSTAAVYGDPLGNELLTETQETRPLSPYAKTKLLCEKLIISTEIEGFRYGILRFFNVAGASRSELVERDGRNLIPILLSDFFNSKRFTIFG